MVFAIYQQLVQGHSDVTYMISFAFIVKLFILWLCLWGQHGKVNGAIRKMDPGHAAFFKFRSDDFSSTRDVLSLTSSFQHMKEFQVHSLFIFDAVLHVCLLCALHNSEYTQNVHIRGGDRQCIYIHHIPQSTLHKLWIKVMQRTLHCLLLLFVGI